MASSFAELYSDYQDAIKLYTEKLDFTERMFMRQISRGMQKFQRETEYIERYVSILPNADTNFYVPDDLLRVVEMRDCNNNKILQHDFMQWARQVEKWPTGYLETPTDYILRTENILSPDAITDYLRSCACASSMGTPQRVFAIWGRRIHIYPWDTFANLLLRYIPDIHAFSQSSIQWNTTDPTTGLPNGWFPDNRFDNMFRTTVISPSLAPYEDAFVNYAIAQYVKAKGSANYKAYENDFWAEVERGKKNKPLYLAEAVSDYFMAPWS